MSDPFALDDEALPPSPPAAGPLVVPADAPWLVGLNPEQHQAVTTLDGPLLVLSGAGTGKTRVLTARLAHLLASRQAQPWQCLAVTFTNRAAREMRERVTALIGPIANDLWLGTFHSLCLRILRRHAEAVGLTREFTILDADDQIRLLKRVIEEEGFDPKSCPPPAVMAQIQRWKDRGLSPDKLPPPRADDVMAVRAAVLYRPYQQRLLGLNACDFGDLLLHVLTLFLTDESVLRQWQGRFRYLLVDEYQDTNVAQYLWLRLLAQAHHNICCVGDDDQSIYSWRGAEIGNILRFEQDFPGAQLVRLERNYRSTPPILAAAAGLIAHNQGRLGKTLRPGRPHDPETVEPVRSRAVWDGEAEARMVVETIEGWRRRGEPLSGMAILVRVGFQTREFEERLIATGVPYRVIGGPRFYERAEIRDALAYLRLVISPSDSLAFERIINQPKRGLGAVALAELAGLARAQGVPMLEAARRAVAEGQMKPRPRKALAAFVTDLDHWRSLRDALPPEELTATVLEDSGYIAMWREDKAPDAPGRVENLSELIAAIAEYESVASFLEHVALVMENDAQAEGDRVVVMTLHGAKGLEFDSVFLPGWEEDLFPHARALEESNNKGLEEERRLAYVGLTRARRRVVISFAANRRIYNQWRPQTPSRFLAEIPDREIVREAASGLFAGGGAVSPRRRGAFAIGARVSHAQFGFGTVLSVDGSTLRVAFDEAGPRTLRDTYVTAV